MNVNKKTSYKRLWSRKIPGMMPVRRAEESPPGFCLAEEKRKKFYRFYIFAEHAMYRKAVDTGCPSLHWTDAHDTITYSMDARVCGLPQRGEGAAI